MSVPALVLFAAGARETGGGETQGGGAEEELRGEGEGDPQSGRESERAAHTSASAGEPQVRLLQYLFILLVTKLLTSVTDQSGGFRMCTFILLKKACYHKSEEKQTEVKKKLTN